MNGCEGQAMRPSDRTGDSGGRLAFKLETGTEKHNREQAKWLLRRKERMFQKPDSANSHGLTFARRPIKQTKKKLVRLSLSVN